MESSCVGECPKFVEHLVVATVGEFVEEMIEDLVQEMNVAMALPGVLATHVGRCELMLGEEDTFMVHIRAVDTASCEAAYMAASEVYEKHLALHDINFSDGYFGDSIVVKFDSNLVGAWDVKWPAIRIAIFQYKSDTSEERKESLIKSLSLLPTLFPYVKQVSWGRNVARGRTEREIYGYADADLGVILGFSCCQDMHALGADPKYWELLNYHGISVLEHYQGRLASALAPRIYNYTTIKGTVYLDYLSAQVATVGNYLYANKLSFRLTFRPHLKTETRIEKKFAF